MSDWIYEWSPSPGVRAEMFGPASFGWAWHLTDHGNRIAEGVALTRVGALAEITQYLRGDPGDLIVTGLRAPHAVTAHSGP